MKARTRAARPPAEFWVLRILCLAAVVEHPLSVCCRILPAAEHPPSATQPSGATSLCCIDFFFLRGPSCAGRATTLAPRALAARRRWLSATAALKHLSVTPPTNPKPAKPGAVVASGGVTCGAVRFFTGSAIHVAEPQHTRAWRQIGMISRWECTMEKMGPRRRHPALRTLARGAERCRPPSGAAAGARRHRGGGGLANVCGVLRAGGGV